MTSSLDVPDLAATATEPMLEGLTAYLHDRVHVRGQPKYSRFSGGNSNLTYLVEIGDEAYVVKREPPGAKARSAHDMRREFRVLSSLQSIYPLAPKPIALCEDEAVFGGVFVVMQRIPGLIVRVAEDGGDALAAQFLGLIDALADLHRVDLSATDLQSVGRPDGYRRRQTEGWIRRFRDSGSMRNPLAEHVMGWLSRNIPSEPERTTVIHNDFKMDNLVWDPLSPDRLAGVLDWEMATLGDPLMDLACTLSFWVEVGDPVDLLGLRAMPSASPHVSGRDEALRRYLARTGSEIDDFRFYRCFGLFRRAAIEQQKFSRFSTGQTSDPRFRDLDRSVAVLLAECERTISI